MLLIPFLLMACDPASDDACKAAAAQGPELTLGTGETSFVSLADGDRVGWDYGSQGGQHVWAALRVKGIVQGLSSSIAVEGNPLVSMKLKSDGERLGELGETPHFFTVYLDGTWEFVGDRVVIEEGGDTGLRTDLHEKQVTLSATLTDACGTKLEKSVELILDGNE